MQNFKKLVSILAILGILTSCSVKDYLSKSAQYSFQVGTNKGGITENTDLSVVPGAIANPESNIDAYSGATFLGFNAGAQINLPVKRNSVQTGVFYMYNRQRFSYADWGNVYTGVRNLNVLQIQYPLTWNISIFKNTLQKQQIQLRMGYHGQLNIVTSREIGTIPEYTLKPWSNGATMGITFYPVTFGNGSKLGLFIDDYRGSAIYHDYYNQDTFEMPGYSHLKAGFTYQIK